MTMIIQKHFDLDNTKIQSNLSEYIYENIACVDKITDTPMSFSEYNHTKLFELVMYWAVYHFEEKIKDIGKLQEFINGLLVGGVFFSEMHFLIKEYINAV